MAAEDARFAAADLVSWYDAGEELTLFDGASREYFALNGSAAAIWRELAAGRGVGEVADALASRFDTGRPAILADITAFVRAAIERNLLVSVA